MGTVNLKFDTELLKRCSKNYDTFAQDLDTLADSLQNTIDELESSGWDTPAGKKFQEKFVGDWKSSFDVYLDMLRTLSQMLDTAATDYQDLYDNDISQLKIG